MNKEINKDKAYHLGRLCYILGDENVPWHVVVHALREGLNLPGKTYILTENDYAKHPEELRELVTRLKAS